MEGTVSGIVSMLIGCAILTLFATTPPHTTLQVRPIHDSTDTISTPVASSALMVFADADSDWSASLNVHPCRPQCALKLHAITFRRTFCSSVMPFASISYVLGCGEQWSAVVSATLCAGLLEAFTTQLDNAFVPLIYYALLSL